VSLEEQLRNDAQSLREVGWFNRAIMMDAAANEIKKLNERIKRLEEAGDEAICPIEYASRARIWTEAKEAKL
jgi:hypothetical protein